MRILLRIAIALGVLFAAALGALAFFLPQIVKGDAVRARIETAARDAIGRDLVYADLDVGLLPPSLVVVQPKVSGDRAGAPALLEAERVELRIALAPLLARAVVLDSVVVQDATIHLERTRDGLVLPTPPARESGAGERTEEGSGVALALRGLSVRDATLLLHDAAISPAVSWELRDVDADLHGDALDAPFDVSTSLAVASGGRVEVEGSASLAGDVDLTVELDAFDLAPLAPYLDSVSKLAGAVSGTVRAKGPAGSPSEVSVDLTIANGVLQVGEILVEGAMDLEAGIAGEQPGRFRIDATRARVSYAQVHTRPAGEPKMVVGKVVRKDDGTIDVVEWKLTAGDVHANGSAVVGERVKLVANVPATDFSALHPFVPALAEYRVSGPFRLDGLRIATAPLEVRGSIPLDGVSFQLPDAGRVAVRGGLVAEGDVVRTQQLALAVAENEIGIEGSLRDLAGARRFEIHTQTDAADTNLLLSTFTSVRDRLFGPLAFRGDVQGALGEPGSIWRAMDGVLSIDITPGRLVGVSILKATMDTFDAAKLLGLLGLVRSPAVGSDLQRYYREEFQSLTGTLRFADGVARTDDFRLDYGDYRVELAGTVGLEDLGLDMHGRLVMGPQLGADLSNSLARALKLPPNPDAGAFVVPLPSVKGTLTNPAVRADFGQLTSTLLANVPLVGGAAGDAAGEVIKGLGELLGGGRKER